MNILEEIRKEQEIIKEREITSNWFIHKNNWYKFDEGRLFTQDPTKSGPESIIEITDSIEYERILTAYKQK